MKITSQPCLLNLGMSQRLSHHQQHESDDGYTSLNALDTIAKFTAPNSSHSSSLNSFDDEGTLVCGDEAATKGEDPLTFINGMYRLKVKSSTLAVEFHGNKRLVRKYRAKRREMVGGEQDATKTVSLDREHRPRQRHLSGRKEQSRVNKHSSPCRLVTMLVV